jgi:hypothetical protein
MIVHLKGSAVKLSATQLPDIYRKIIAVCRKRGIEKIPDLAVSTL